MKHSIDAAAAAQVRTPGASSVELVIFHYHLLPGGVTGVIVGAVRALMCNLPAVTRIRIVTGRAENSADVLESIKADIPFSRGTAEVTVELEPEIDYLPEAGEPAAPDRAVFEVAADRTGAVIPPTDRIQALARTLRARFSGEHTVWWVHNYHLGKNPVFTAALLELAHSVPSQRMILEIHDFPESGRYANLALLERYVARPLYPSLPNLVYAVINERDRRLLVGAGLPSECVHLLTNPVSADTASPPDRLQARETLRAAYRGFQGFLHDRPVLLYPVRSIRRKNILEAALLSELCGTNLVVTLPGVSAVEKPYSDLVRRCFQERLIHGLWGTGLTDSGRSVPFMTIVGAADLVVSSSVQEGFGYLFIESLLWRKPLFGRYLETLDGMMEFFSGYPHHFYTSVHVPFLEGTRAALRTAYREKLASLARYIPHDRVGSLTEEIERLVAGETVEFSYLHPTTQYEYLVRLRDRGFADEIAALNREPVSALERLIKTGPTAAAEPSLDAFGPTGFSESFSRLLDSFGAERMESGGIVRNSAPSQPTGADSPAAFVHGSPRDREGVSNAGGADVSYRMLAGFTRLEYLRLLYD